jgi:hypothetical protein
MRRTSLLAVSLPLAFTGCCCSSSWWVQVIDPIHEDCDRDATEVPQDLQDLPVPAGGELVCAGQIYGRVSVALWDVGGLPVDDALGPAEVHLRGRGWRVGERKADTDGYRTRSEKGDEEVLLGTAERYVTRRVTWLRGPQSDDLLALFLVAGGAAIIVASDDDDDGFDIDDDD